MAVKKPVVLYNGVLSELQAGDTTSGTAGSGTVVSSGTAVLDFSGSLSGTNFVQTIVIGQAGILSTSTIKAYLMADATATHNAYEHMIVPLNIVCGSIVAGIGFTISATTNLRLTGTFNVRWEWF